ncbi:MAG TPA: BadF/BadG/BcrA/BcrD ATPase family protein [Ilumatobacteraceae bacterium]|nr:BadF/BadG/BcrA/BcrD ATPase family protein [Ilumatobacteraceae bacterium]
MSSTQPVVVGVDGGGTKTDVVVADLNGREIAVASTGGANHERMGVTKMAAVIGAALDEALATADRTRADVVASAFGLAGVDWDSDIVLVESALDALGLSGQRVVVNDSQVALRAGCTQSWGIVSNIGTGTVTAGVNRDGEWFRTMAVGWGEPTGSWTMVSDSLHAIAAHHHRTGPATSLTELYLGELGYSSVIEMFEAITRRRCTIGGYLAPLVDRAAATGDRVADEILTRVADQHADMVGGVATQLMMLDDDFELVTAGGVHASGGPFTERFQARVHHHCPGAVLVPLVGRPATGAIQLALDLVTHFG